MRTGFQHRTSTESPSWRAEQWRRTLTKGEAEVRSFVDLDGDRIVGFALAGLARDEDPPRQFQL